MDYTKFQEWLQNEKGMSLRSAKDVISRIKRVLLISSADEITSETVETLNQNEVFQGCSMFIKSQLRRSVVLYNEFKK